MSNILITGGCGFIGYNLTHKLVENGHNICVIDKNNTNIIDGIKYIHTSTSNLDLIDDDIIKNPQFDVVFHLGEYSKVTPSFDDTDELLDSNYIGTYKVLEYCVKYNIKIVYAASSTKYSEDSGNESPYAFSKKKNVELIKNYSKWYGLEYAITYFYNNYGPKHDTCNDGWETVVSIFEKQKRRGEKLTVVSPGTQKRTFTYVGDTTDGLIKAWKRNENDEYQLTSDDEYSIIELANLFGGNYKIVSSRKGESNRIIDKDLVTYTKDVLNWDTKYNLNNWVDSLWQ